MKKSPLGRAAVFPQSLMSSRSSLAKEKMLAA
jgi:hypothetical protein